METDVYTLKDSFQIGYDAYVDSRNEALEIWDAYHNRQWSAEHLNVLENRGQPKETFNVVKLFCRMLLGYYSTVVNTATAVPRNVRDIPTAAVLNDTMAYVFRDNNAVTEGDKIKLGAFISGLFIVQEEVENTGEFDRFGRPIRRCVLTYIPDNEVVLDPLSRSDNYTDASVIHRFKWLSEENVISTYGKEKFDRMYEYYNHLNIEEAEFEYTYNGQFTGKYKIFNNYLVVHSEVEDDNGQMWTVHWFDEVELYRKKINRGGVKFSYRVQKLHTSNRTEHYGLFREIIESQKAINQAIVKIQLLVNTQKIFVETGAVDDIDEFSDSVNRVNSVVEVLDLNGIKVENMSKEILDLYTVVDKAFDRIQRLLGINDSFLGQAFASDSGRKVKLQQNASIMSQRYLTSRIELFYYNMGWDVAKLIQQFYTAEQVLRITDEVSGDRWVSLNQPMQIFTGKNDELGQPIFEIPYEEVLDDNDKPMVDKDGNRVFAPIPEEATEIKFTKYNIEIQSVAYNDEDEKNQLMMETILSGNVGQLLAQVNPGGYFKAVGLSLKTMKTKYSPEIAKILEETAQMLGADPEATQEAKDRFSGGNQVGSPPKSSTLKLPQNTNEGVR